MPTLLERCPAGEDETSTRLQSNAYVAERCHRVSEEHDTHAIGHDIERGTLKRHHLCVTEQQCYIMQSAFVHALSGDVEHRLGDVDGDNAALVADDLRQRQGHRAGAATDFKYALAAG